jgi:ABC-type phosphate/phosphonate transport system substrate-binding protein
MKRVRGLGLLCSIGLAAGLAALTPARQADAEEMPKAPTVRVGLASSLFRDTPEVMIQAIARPFRSLVESQTGLSGQLVPNVKPDDLCVQMKDDKLQLGVLHGYEYAWLRQTYPDLKPLMIAVNQQSHLKANLVVRNDNKAASLEDLKGLTIAVPRRTREHCHLFLDRHCQTTGCCTKEYFGKIVASPSVEEGVDGVILGRTDAVLVDGVFLDWYKENKPTAYAKLKVVQESEVFPAAVVVHYGTALDADTLRRFREGMISAKDNPRGLSLMTLCQITSFEPIPTDYEQLLTDIAKAYPAPKGKEK